MQTQRTILDLRIEIQNLQRELGVARAAQARLDGELKEAKHRVVEAQRMAEAQHEELAKVREEREKMAHAGRDVQGQLVELGRLRQQVADTTRDQTRIQALETALEKQSQEVSELKASVEKNLAKSKTKNANRTTPTGVSNGSPPRKITVQPGDTLQDLARKHRVDPTELKTLNKLTTERLIPGQELLLPDPKG
jgi:LysM repeat protein